MRIHAIKGLALGALMLAIGGCSDSDMGDVSMQLATRGPASVATGGPGQLVVGLGPDEITVDEVALVLRKVRLDGAPTASCPEDVEGDSQCAQLHLGPVLFDLPLGEGAEPIFSAAVLVGTYSRIKFQIHRPTNANEDADFVADHPEFENISIRVLGSYNGTPFTFASDLTEVEDVVFAEPVEVAVDGEVQVTLHVDVAGWFASEDGTGLVNPSEANDGGPFESLVERQIRESFRAFRDGDLDGAADPPPLSPRSRL
jgi:hypothetical protein